MSLAKHFVLGALRGGGGGGGGGGVLLYSVENKAKFVNHFWDNEKAY